MAQPAVCLVGATTPGNVGTAARAMKNFGLTELLLIDPPPLERDSEAYGFAGQARGDVLADHTVITVDDLVTSYYTVGFTAYPNEDASKHVRYPTATPEELAAEVATLDADVALVFGRERIGLTNAELARLDRICTIPADPAYPTLNLGQAVTIACYECRRLTLERDQLPLDRHTRADERELEHLYERVDDLLCAIDYPVEKRDKTNRMIRRILGRAHPTGREVRTAHGILRRLERALGRA